MFVYLVTYDLNKPGQRYDDVYKYIKQYSYKHAGTSAWLIQTDKSGATIQTELLQVVDANDHFYVFKLTSTWNGQGPQTVHDWLKIVGISVG